MKFIFTPIFFVALFTFDIHAQTEPIITSWLQNTTVKGRHYVKNNSTAIQDTATANVQAVKYSASSVYVYTNGVPAYVTGPFLDNNPSLTTAQNAIFKFPKAPAQNTGTPTNTKGGNIGIFINGVAMFDYRDGVAWNSTTNALCGGPGNPPCPGGPNANLPWNRDAILAEKGGFDCSKGHPAMGNYHHHQNPSAFKLDRTVISTVCNLYDADGLYVIDTTKHSPLIGFAYDGYPVYGAYAYKNVDATGGIVRMKSSYSLRSITTRTTSPTGASVTSGPVVSTTYPLGYFREDYQYTATTASTPDYLDEHNGRFCKTPEFPNGTYCYFATVDENHNSAYPYLVGPTYYGIVSASAVTSITESVTTYTPQVVVPTSIQGFKLNDQNVNIIQSNEAELIAVQVGNLIRDNIHVNLYDGAGKLISSKMLYQGATIVYFDTKTLYEGLYIVELMNNNGAYTQKVMITRE